MTTYAQDNNSLAGWEIEEHCIEEPRHPPDDWTYDGTLLMSGYAGIHAMQSNWETPHVEAFYRSDVQGNRPIIRGQISPDGNWYAVPIGDTWVEPSFNRG